VWLIRIGTEGTTSNRWRSIVIIINGRKKLSPGMREIYFVTVTFEFSCR